MFSFVNDPGADGFGIAFFDAVAPGGGRLDLTVGHSTTWRGPDWDLAEAQLAIPIFNAYQVHGIRVLNIDQNSDSQQIVTQAADALITTQPRVGLAVRAADCLPVLFADPQAGVVAAAHAGRVGLGDGVLLATVGAMKARGAHAIRAWIGPHICGDCYEVPSDLQEEFCAADPAARARSRWGTPSLDLGAAATTQLRESGCDVVRVDPCTRESATLHSYRRDGAGSGRQAGVVWLS